MVAADSSFSLLQVFALLVLLSSAANINALPVIQKADVFLPIATSARFSTLAPPDFSKQKPPTPKEAGGQENNF
jgi:hypothetical protein